MNKYSNILKQITTLPLDVHLMVEDVETYVKLYTTLEPNIITFHYEAVKDKEKICDIIKQIRDNNCQVGMAIKPETSIKDIYEFLPYLNLVLVMTVEPGKGGQSLIPQTLEKVKALNEFIKKENIDIDIEVDGGINEKTAKEAKKAGANILVAGTAITRAEDYKKIVEELKKI